MNKNSFLRNVKTYFREYCNHTSVHGFQYFGEKKRSTFERFWWFVVFAACLGMCVAALHAVYKKWADSPVIVTFANKQTPIYEIPFPAITICPESKTARDKFNYTEIMQKKLDNRTLSALEKKQFEYISLICKYYGNINYENNKTFTDEFFDVIDELKTNFSIEDCYFMSLPMDCNVTFTPVITNEGICYSFNLLDRQNIFRKNVVHYKNYHRNNIYRNSSWSFQNGYNENAGMETFPSRAYLSGAAAGLSLNIISRHQDLDYACNNVQQGYKVMLHTPTTIPLPSEKYFLLPLNQRVVAAVQPAMITTSERIGAYGSERRGCFFQAERRLKHFTNYTLNNCKIECLTNFTLQICGCVNFFMPRENGTKICGTGSIRCMEEADRILHQIELGMKLENSTFFERISKPSCNCLPVCSDLTYEVVTSQVDLNWNEWYKAQRIVPRFQTPHGSSLTVFFKSDIFMSSERNEFYGPIDFLANFGGLLGLFTGFSVLSFMELLYFLSVRLISNRFLHGRWTGQDTDD